METLLAKFMNSIDMQTLEQLAAEKVAISVCESEDIQCMIGSFSEINGDCSVGFSGDQCNGLCDQITQKLDEIGVPEIIIDLIMKKTWPICFEIYKWIFCHKEMDIASSPDFVWTPLANIDHEKTAEMLVKNESIDIKKRYILACLYCLESEIRSLWKVMSLREKRTFFVRGNLKKSDLNRIVLFWTYNIQEAPTEYWESQKLNITNLFKYAVINGYPTAVEYFFGRLKKQLRNRMVENCFYIHLREKGNSYRTSISHFAVVLFITNELRHRSPIIDNYMGGCFFRYFLEWPFQKHFMTVVDQFRHGIRHLYGELLSAIFEKDLGGFKDYDYKNLFKELWLTVPVTEKVSFAVSKCGFDIFFRFIKKHFGFIFEEQSFSQKAKLRAAILQQDISEKNSEFGKENVDFFKFLIRERITLESTIRKFLESYLPLGELKYLIDLVIM